eukprot:443127_1
MSNKDEVVKKSTSTNNKAEISKVVLVQADNGKLGHIDESCQNVTDVIIWGGYSYNCAESGISSMLLNRFKELERFIFIPQKHKGGRMIRPKYCNGDRNGCMTFPSLHTLGYWADIGPPKKYGWICPNLKKLIVFEPIVYYGTINKQKWISKLNEETLKDCPLLQTILYVRLPFTEKYNTKNENRIDKRAKGYDFNNPMKYEIVIEMNAPIDIGWNISNVIQLIKQNKIQCNTQILCNIAEFMPDAITDTIFKYLFRLKWNITHYNNK